MSCGEEHRVLYELVDCDGEVVGGVLVRPHRAADLVQVGEQVVEPVRDVAGRYIEIVRRDDLYARGAEVDSEPGERLEVLEDGLDLADSAIESVIHFLRSFAFVT